MCNNKKRKSCFSSSAESILHNIIRISIQLKWKKNACTKWIYVWVAYIPLSIKLIVWLWYYIYNIFYIIKKCCWPSVSPLNWILLNDYFMQNIIEIKRKSIPFFFFVFLSQQTVSRGADRLLLSGRRKEKMENVTQFVFWQRSPAYCDYLMFMKLFYFAQVM